MGIFFFFQAEDGIRDVAVTGVQTCALPISADAVGTSLSLVFLNAASGSFAYLRQRRVDLQLGWKFAAATIPGAIGGAYLTRAMSSNEFSLAFGVLLVLIAVLLFSGITAAPSARAGARRIVDTDRKSTRLNSS